ncbi:type II toxin-antitoxin system VapC family toxin [Desulfobacter latus]|uniref:Type II toxin-antitoxin system VapC family toxin n=1 Tax=Desulfobacter latus TaxID=2292 RepID=A0A850T6N9_9BACT|nr:type II toxin-antitoxin system VapC family toxin [Desulfobacter latus]NWH05042.1 type II toxin-antitoxin system VapC family toxin [Desulfobacter latus]
MINRRYVLDANVFLEIIFNRPLQGKAKKILEDAILERIQIIVPSLLLDEITEVLCGNMDNLIDVECHLKYIEKMAHSGVLNIIVPNCSVRMKAIELARTGNNKSGYPELTDCLYHALAIINKAVFITNDKRHIAKILRFGYVVGLTDYETDL